MIEMNYDFDEIIDRKNTSSENVEGFRSYMFSDEPDISLPFEDDELIRMWVADMEFAAAPEICQAVRDRADKRIFGYTGMFDSGYYDAFASWCMQRYGWEFLEEQLVISPGVIPALYELVGLLTEPDEKVLFLSPSYGFFKHAARYNGRQFICSPLKNSRGSFSINFDDLAEKASRPDVKLLIWCNPHNPTGRVWSMDEAERVARIAEENGLWIISDEIHCDLLRNGQQHIPMGKVMPDYSRLITCMAASKTFNLAGMLFSNIIIRDAGLRAKFRRRDKLGGSLNPLSLAANRAAYEKGAPWLAQLKDYLDENFRFAVDFITDNIPGAVCSVPQATYLLWVDMNGCGIRADNLSKFFAKEAGVLVESGNRLFVDNAAGFVRINLAMPRALVREGLGRMADAVRRHRVPSIDEWMKEAKQHETAKDIGMYLTHNGVVRETAKARVRSGAEDTKPVIGMRFSYDRDKVDAAVRETYRMDGIYYIRTWLAEGELQVGDDIMMVLIGGDIRPHIVDALQYLVGRIKNECVTETEIFGE